MRDEIDRRPKRREGTQLDSMKRVRKEMPPATRVMTDKGSGRKRTNNWKDYLNDDEEEWGKY